MKIVLISFLLLSFTGCQAMKAAEAAKETETEASLNRKAVIREEKRKQSEADLPFRGLDTTERIIKIAFGSGVDQDQPQMIWNNILKHNPDLFILAGDAAYTAKPEQKPIGAQYKKLNRNAEYRMIREKIPFMAIWNDEDYGQIDGGANNPDKEIARTEFLKYWTYARNTIPADQKALYHSKTFGSKKQTVQVIMLDTRWDRSPLKVNTEDTYNSEKPEPNTFPKPFLPDDDKSKRILSEAQWSWLDNELKKPASLKILVSPIQVIANEHSFEKWGNFPAECERLLTLIRKAKAKHLIIISGDRHISAIAKEYIQGFNTIYDITSSGLNNPVPRDNVVKDTSYLNDAYGAMAYGLIEINWDKRKAKIELRTLDEEVKQNIEVPF